MPKRATRALQGIRNFYSMIPNYQGVHQGSKWSIEGDKAGTPPLHGNGWQADGTNCIYYESYIDLSALEMDDLTLMPIEVGLQDPGFYTESDGGLEMVVMDIISQQRLDSDTLSSFMTGTLNQYNNAPGMLGTPIDYHMITMGNLRVMYKSAQVTTTSTLKPFITQFASPFGSGEPVVTQKLWCYRFVYYEGRAGETMEIPAARMILRGEVADEKEYVYIQRLRRSYEIQANQ
jgi:hypothetical protein